MSVTRNMELRHLSISDTARLSQILDNNDSWKSLMEKIPKNLDDIQNVANDAQRITRKYSADNIKQIDSRSKELCSSPTQILLDEWGTSGKKRATVSDLLEILIRVQLYRAADFVAKDILREAPPKRPENGPGARIDVSMPVETFDEQAIERILNNVGYPYTSQLAAQMIEKSIDSLINNNNRDFGQPINMDHHQKFIFNNSSELHSDQFESDTSESDTDLIKFSAAVSASAVPTLSNSNNNNNNHININSNSNNNDGEPLQVPLPTVFPTRPTGLSSSLSSNASTHSSSPSSASSSSSSSSIQSASSSMLQMMNDCILPANLPMAYSMNSDDDKHSNVTATNEIETTTNTVSSSSSSSSVSGVSSSYTCSTASNQTNQSTLIPDIGNLKIRDRSSEQQLPPLLPSSPPPPLPQPQSLSSSSLVISEQHMPSPSTPSLTHSGINGHSTMSTDINNDDAKNLSDYIPNLSLLNGTGS